MDCLCLVDNMLVDLHLSVTNRSSRARAWTARFTDRDANHNAIFHDMLLNDLIQNNVERKLVTRVEQTTTVDSASP